MSYFGKLFLKGETDGGLIKDVPVDGQGHLEVAIHDPILPFGSIHVESLSPIFQMDAVYGLKQDQITTTSGSGTATASGGMMVVTTGTTVASQGIIQGRKRLRYRAGQGVVGKFTSLFTTPVQSSYQLAGFGHAVNKISDALAVGVKKRSKNPARGVEPWKNIRPSARANPCSPDPARLFSLRRQRLH